VLAALSLAHDLRSSRLWDMAFFLWALHFTVNTLLCTYEPRFLQAYLVC